MDVCGAPCVCPVPMESRRGHLDLLELRLQVIVTAMWVLGTELGSSVGAVNALNPQAISVAPPLTLSNGPLLKCMPEASECVRQADCGMPGSSDQCLAKVYQRAF